MNDLSASISRKNMLLLFKMLCTDRACNFPSPEDQKQVDLFHEAVSSGGSRHLTVMQAAFRGNARSGKTSLLNVMLGKEAKPDEPSTGVICKPARIEITRSTVMVDEHDWTPIVDLDEEAVLLVQDMTIEQEMPDVPARGTSAVTISDEPSREQISDFPPTTSQTDAARLAISLLIYL